MKLTTTLAALLIAASTQIGAQVMEAEKAAYAALPLPKLEVLFWNCEYGAAHGGIDDVDMQNCVLVYEAVKARKFDGSYPELLEWWKKVKPAEIAKRAKNSKK